MWFKKIPIEVWRLMEETGSHESFADPEWAYHHTIYASKQPFTGDDSYKMGQVFENVRDRIGAAVDEDVLKTDCLKYDCAFHRIQYINVYDGGVLPHKEILTTDSQWEPS